MSKILGKILGNAGGSVIEKLSNVANKFITTGDEKRAFQKDMEQIFVNCKLFNTPESELYEDGAKLEAYYRELLSVGENSGSSTDGATK